MTLASDVGRVCADTGRMGTPAIDLAPGALGDGDARHIIDVLIEERAGRLLERPLLWLLIRTFLYPVLGYRRAISVADEIAPLSGHEAMQRLVAALDLRLQVEGTECVPRAGPGIVVANHPTGIADGIALYALLEPRRKDLAIFANLDALRVCPGFADIIIPVQWRVDLRTHASSRQTLKAAVRAFDDGRLVVLFPSGRLARMTDNGLRERPWLPTAVSFARRFGVPLIPLHISARNSALFYTFWEISEELRDMTLFHEVLNKRRYRYRMRFGEPIDADRLAGDPETLTRQLQRWVEFGLGRGEQRFQPGQRSV